jgi:hypothetical protein
LILNDGDTTLKVSFIAIASLFDLFQATSPKFLSDQQTANLTREMNACAQNPVSG